MRLIDVEALLSKNCMALKGPNDGEYDSCSECLWEPYGYCCMEMRGDLIYNAPTIDAIPVEWLKKVRKGDNLTLDDVETIDWLILWWHKEQEGR